MLFEDLMEMDSYNNSIFAKIEEFPNYLIYKDGRVQNINTKQFLKSRIDMNGYSYVGLYKNKLQKFVKIHRLLAQTFISNPENKKTVNHIDGDKLNNSLDNLEWMTNQENVQHAFDTGLNENVREASRIVGRNTQNLPASKPVQWIHPEYGTYFCTIMDLVRQFPEDKLDSSHLSKVSTRQRKVHKDWRVLV